jgi:hypothetical protein
MKAVLVVATSAVALSTLEAQVGHDPASSPYRDLRFGQFVTLSAGPVFGNGGRIGVGPHQGTMVILRHDFLADRPVTIALGAGWARLDRFVANLAVVPRELEGPVNHDVWFGEGTAQLNLTGGKTWHNLAPYLSLGIGLAIAERIPADSSPYRFGTKFYLAPAAGARIFLTRRLYLKVEARTTFWNLSYPPTFRDDPDGAFGPAEPLLSGELKEWSPTPVLHAGLGFAFRRPFF